MNGVRLTVRSQNQLVDGRFSMRMCSSIVATLWLFGLGTACEPAPGDVIVAETGQTSSGKADDPSACADLSAPMCVTSCGDGVEVTPTCTDARWRCDDAVDVAYCPTFADECDAETPCGAGYTCVQSVTHPVPVDDVLGVCRKGAVTRRPDVEACRPDGTLDASEFLATTMEHKGQIVKIAGELSVQMTCSHNACGEDNPCCNTCLGNYVVELRDPNDDKRWVDLIVDIGAPACSGTTCDTSCGPLILGDTYTIWGVLNGCQGLHNCTMLVMGSCPL